MIAKILQDAVIDPLWLKIPRHSSSSSTRLIEILEQTGQYQLLSGTTVKIQSKLPNPIILNRYHNLSDFLYCTGVPQAEGDPCFGIIKYVFDLFGEFDVHITCEGNARVVQGLIIILYVFADFPTLYVALFLSLMELSVSSAKIAPSTTLRWMISIFVGKRKR